MEVFRKQIANQKLFRIWMTNRNKMSYNFYIILILLTGSRKLVSITGFHRTNLNIEKQNESEYGTINIFSM